MALTTLCASGGRVLTRSSGGNLERVSTNRPAESATGYGRVSEAGADEVATALGDNATIDCACVIAHSPG